MWQVVWWPSYVSTFHTKNMSMIHHSFATCRFVHVRLPRLSLPLTRIFNDFRQKATHTNFGNLSLFLKSKKCCDGKPWGLLLEVFPQFRMPRYDPKTWRICDNGKSFLETGQVVESSFKGSQWYEAQIPNETNSVDGSDIPRIPRPTTGNGWC